MRRRSTTLTRSSHTATAINIKTTVEDAARVERRRAQLTQAAIACFSERGYHLTTIRDVAQRADVSVGLVYQYIGDKEDLLFMALQEVLDSYMRQIPTALEGITDPLQRFCTAVQVYSRVNGSSVDATVLAYRETKSLSKERRTAIMQKELDTNGLIATCVRDCIDAGLFERIDVDMFVYQIVMFCHTWALKAWHFAKVMDVDTYVRRGLDLMLRGVLTRAGVKRMHRLEALASNAR
ncbi:MAG TPA: TetR/AcrR family transcriptional regulator [Acetobacteraceae bacterium]|nr:TetR/AcrR family transcriptional regulator [Acetobacteraceae bacterium]